MGKGDKLMAKLFCRGCGEYVDTTNDDDLCYDCEEEEVDEEALGFEALLKKVREMEGEARAQRNLSYL